MLTRVFDRRLKTFRTLRNKRAVSVNLQEDSIYFLNVIKSSFKKFQLVSTPPQPTKTLNVSRDIAFIGGLELVIEKLGNIIL